MSKSGALLRCLDPETAHRLTLWGLRRGFAPSAKAADDSILGVRLWGHDFPNPLGLAAGFDKDARAMGPLLNGLGQSPT